MPSPSPLEGVPPHVRSLLSTLHKQSMTQESAITDADFESRTFDDVMRDKFIALDEDKSQYLYQLSRIINAKTVVEAGTSFGVSTIYLALAVSANAAATGGTGRVIATENEPTKAAKAREHWAQCGDVVTNVIDLREGDLRETLKRDVEAVDLLLLDIWTPMALPTLKLILPHMRYGAVVVADNTIAAADKYKELLDFMRAPGSGFVNMTLPFNNGLEVSAYLPGK
ncbi:S-adenosyl-L-methionine-dependent methyltransferase [Aspergillus bertholletiae]|uniref:S-adenosyl-L-methionine-dependent methyltransferase n=1 Tax=Aspergillus bertholletiae TaxID=1226010 RepID=A0A5N7AXC6_9EURO|nr:S-adenosyl-L-methionine-dependent methyltransferase [Aspergillus bertholletiae]